VFDELRAEPRHEVALRHILMECPVFWEHTGIVNMARLGFLARTRLNRKTGTTVKLHLPDLGIVAADVVWCSGGFLGGRFQAPIDQSQFAAFLEAYGR
jgi:hypothetical protein